MRQWESSTSDRIQLEIRPVGGDWVTVRKDGVALDVRTSFVHIIVPERGGNQSLHGKQREKRTVRTGDIENPAHQHRPNGARNGICRPWGLA